MPDSGLLKIAKMEARRANARFRALLDAAVDAMVVIDAQGTVEVLNRSAVEAFGYAPEEVIGNNISMLMPEPYRSQHDRYLASYLATGRARVIGIGREVAAMRKNGTVFPIELSVGEVHDGGQPRFIGIIRDITARKSFEIEMRQQRDKLAHVTRLSTMGEMAAGIAHEVNQPLTAIATYANACRRMADSKAPDIGEIDNLLDKISTQALRAGEVIRRLRGFVKAREGELELYAIKDLAKDVSALAEVDAHSHGIDLELDISGEETTILADPVQIQQVLLNLVRNAIDAMEELGRKEHRKVKIRAFRNDQTVTVEVTDQGPGVTADFREMLFVPFMTTKADGMGLGLSISRSIINAHKGTLSFRENPAGGSVFYFELPIAEGELHK